VANGRYWAARIEARLAARANAALPGMVNWAHGRSRSAALAHLADGVSRP